MLHKLYKQSRFGVVLAYFSFHSISIELNSTCAQTTPDTLSEKNSSKWARFESFTRVFMLRGGLSRLGSMLCWLQGRCKKRRIMLSARLACYFREMEFLIKKYIYMMTKKSLRAFHRRSSCVTWR